MGIGLVIMALTHHDVPHRSMRVLVTMAVTARDTPTATQEAGLYFGGWDHLAQVLGYPDAKHPTGRRELARVLADLQSRGLCKACGVRGGGRSRQVYRLTL